MSEQLGIGLVGCGTVGGGVARLFLDQPDRLNKRAGRPLALRRVAVRDLKKPRAVDVPRDIFTTSPSDVIADPDVQIVAELIGGTTTAKTVVLDALAAGKHVVTANKALVAEHGPELFAAARRAGRAICFEAAVAGGVPIVKALAEGLAANQTTAIQGILNGTSNFILSAMSETGMSYADALAEAQRLGYAEADPTLDVDGTDAAHKLAILAQIAFGVVAIPDRIERQGIDQVDGMDVRFAGELGYTIKLLAEAWSGTDDQSNPTVALHVAPVLLRETDMLAQVRGAFNAIQVVGDAVGETLYQGPGAGMMATASAVVSDIIDLAVGRAQKSFAVANLWADAPARYQVVASDRVMSRFYLRILAHDVPGVLADVARSLAAEGISIASVIQHEAVDGHKSDVVPLVIMTHSAETARVRAALAAVDRLASTIAPAVHYSVAG